MKFKLEFTFLFIALFSTFMHGQSRLPIIDMHLHAHAADRQGPPPIAICTPIFPMPVWDPEESYSDFFMRMLKEPSCPDPVWSPLSDDDLMNDTFKALEDWNIYGILSGPVDKVAKWRSLNPKRIYPALELSVGPGAPSPDSLRAMFKRGDLMVLGEVVTQYNGVYPNDPKLDPYLGLAEELDIPVGIHVGPGPPGVIYLGFKNYRANMHSPFTLEEILVKYPRLRLYIMHGGYPMLDELLAVLYAHPQVYIDVGVIVYTQPRMAFYYWLESIVNAGFGNRVMFGSDQMVWPGVIERSIAVIEEAPFLGESQKRDIFYNNAARFLRFSKEEIANHHKN